MTRLFKFCGAAVLAVALMLSGSVTWAASAESYFNKIRSNPTLLRDFLTRFPKGGELHSHLDGAVYAENYIAWAAVDDKCIDLSSFTVTPPPCDAAADRPRVADIQFDPAFVNPIIDAFSVRNYERGALSGHDQFFATFPRYSEASEGRHGSMLAAVTARAGRQNVLYLEVMDSIGMRRARKLAAEGGEFDGSTALDTLAGSEDINDIVSAAITFTDDAEVQWRAELGCAKKPLAPGCDVKVRYLAQVIRTFPPEQVLAQTLYGFQLMKRDSRYVGINFVAPEDAPITLRDYSLQMQIIREVAALFPQYKNRVTLHAGELAMPLVPPKELRSHIYEAVHVAGASRIGHGVDIIHEDDAMDLLKHMGEQQILVEVNLTSNAVILGIEGNAHPFDLYRAHEVPLALSTDDEGVARIDLTHEYVLATQSYNLSYDYLKELSRNSLAYSFLPGESLFADIPAAKRVKACGRDRAGLKLSDGCQTFMDASEKARQQWLLEERIVVFEKSYK